MPERFVVRVWVVPVSGVSAGWGAVNECGEAGGAAAGAGARGPGTAGSMGSSPMKVAQGDDLTGVRVAGAVLVDQADAGVALVRPGRSQVHSGDHEGHLGCAGAEGTGVDGEVEIVTAEDVAG